MDTTTTATNVGGADVTAATTAATTTTQGKGSLLAYTGFHPVPPLPLASTISTYMHREDQHSWSHTQSVLNPTTAAASASNQTNNGGGGLNNNKRKHEALEGENAASSSLVVPPATGAATATATAAAVGVGAGEAVANADDKRGRNTVVIHPGSRWLRIGRASDILPVSVPHVIARWTKNPKRPVVFKCGVRRPTPLRPDEEDEPLLQQQQEALLQEGEEEEDGEGEDEMEQDGGGDDEEEENEDGLKRKKGKGDAMEKSEGEDGDAEEEGGGGAAQAAGGGDDTEEEKIDEGTARIDGLKAAFKDRLKIYQYRYQKGAAESAVNFNRAQTKKKNGGAETIADHNDLQRITWITSSSTTTNTTTAGTTSGAGAGTGGAKRTTAFFGHDVFLLSDSVMKEYEVRWPLRGMRFNCDKREDVQGVLNDLVDIWTAALVNELEIKRSQFKTMSAVLVVPDLADRIYIKELVQLL
ncbi:actin-like protein arp8, partial [Serendipita sp. 399]